MKKALVVAIVLLALLGGAAYWAYDSLGLIVKLVVEHYGPDVLGVTVRVGSVDISARDGRGVVRRVEIGTPAGFNAPDALKVGEIRVALDPATVTGAVVTINELVVEAPAITYERGDHGTNLEAIQRHIQGYIASSGGPSSNRPAEARAGKRKFIVGKLTVRGARVTMTNPGLRGQGIAFDLPDITLRDIGRRQGGLTPSEIGSLVTAELEARIAQKVLTSVDLLRKGGIGGALDALKGLLR